MPDTITPKQLAYIRVLISDTGIGNPEYLGAWARPWLSMRETGVGRLSNLTFSAATKLIDGLKAKKAEADSEQ
ncbi:hypothetical protein [[Kitasatospora] papulosa]|uniref:hypothetical protein n=1 Tax=[Kitasatospora] papulosa TaxID=1464011 RepID=UPI003629DF44